MPTPPSAMPLQPQRLTRNEAQARTTIAQRGAGLPLRLGTAAWQARLVPTAQPALAPTAEPGLLLRLEWAGAAFALRLPAAAAEQALAAGLGHAALPAVPGELAQAVLEAALADALQALQALGRGTPQITATEHAMAGPLPPHAFDLLLLASEGPEAIAGTLHADGLGLLLLAGLVARRAPQPGPLQDGVPLALHAELGCTRIALHELEALAPGDVVLVQTCFLGAERTLWLSADGRWGLHAQVPADAAPSLTVLHPWTETMPAATAAEETPATAPTEGDLPVRLSFDLGDVALTLAQLRALQPGQALDLGRPLAGAVRIRANGALVGEGDLVEIDGQLGVSVRTLFTGGAAR